MMRWIIATSMKLQFLILILAAVLMFFGTSQLGNMSVDVFPEFNPPLVEIQTEALGLSAEEMEALITVPLEADLLNGVAWLDQIYSESAAGISSILLVFEPGTDPIRARQMVQERLTQTFALPNVSKPPTMLQPLSTASRVMMVGLSSQDMSLIDMSVLARWNIKPRLMGVTGVANVAIWGQREWQVQVQVDPQRLADNQVSLDQIIETTGEALWVSPLSYLESSSPGTAGWIDTPNQRLGIQHILPISSASELAEVSIVGSETLRLGDVTTVVEDHQPLIGDATLNGGNGLLLVIEKFPGANTMEVTRGIDEALELMRPGLGGIEIDTTIFRPANYIELATNNLSTAALIGGVLVALILLAFYFEWRTAVISLVVVPISLVFATFVLYLRGETFNMMALAGLAIALSVIVDNAVIDVENISRRLLKYREEGSERPVGYAILAATQEIRGPLIFALLILLLAVVPVFFIQGLAATFFAPLVTSYVIAVLVSLAVALIITPALCLVLLPSAPLRYQKSPFTQTFKRLYSSMLTPVMHAPVLVLALAGIIGIAGLASLPFLRQSLLPDLKQTDLRIQWEGVPGTSSAEMIRIMSLVSSELSAIPGVSNVGSHVGRAITGDQVVGVNSGELWVNLDPSGNLSFDDTMAAITDVIAGYPGLLSEAQAYYPERLEDTLLGAEHEMIVRVYGHEFDVMQTTAQELATMISEINGVTDAQPEWAQELPQIEIEVDLEAAQRYQVKPGDVRRAATTLLSGLQVGNLYEEQKIFDVVVWAVPELRDSLTDIQQLLIDTPTGPIPLQDVAEVRIVPAPVIIRRDTVSRFVDIEINLSGRDFGSIAQEIEERLRSYSFPLEYRAEIVRDQQTEQGNSQFLVGSIVAAVIGIFLLLQACLNSWRLALVALVLPLIAAGGGVLAVMLAGGVLWLGSTFGFLSILGISIRSSILMVRHFQHLELHEGETFGSNLVMRGSEERFIPILIAGLATVLALLPLILAGNIAGTEILRPMALVVIGGLIVSTFLSLFVMPVMYLHLGSGTAMRFGEEPGPEEEMM